jgi:hypothetical protein
LTAWPQTWRNHDPLTRLKLFTHWYSVMSSNTCILKFTNVATNINAHLRVKGCIHTSQTLNVHWKRVKKLYRRYTANWLMTGKMFQQTLHLLITKTEGSHSDSTSEPLLYGLLIQSCHNFILFLSDMSIQINKTYWK